MNRGACTEQIVLTFHHTADIRNIIIVHSERNRRHVVFGGMDLIKPILLPVFCFSVLFQKIRQETVLKDHSLPAVSVNLPQGFLSLCNQFAGRAGIS